MSVSRRHVLLPVSIIAVAIAVAAIVVINKPKPESADLKTKALLVDAARVVKQDLQITVRAQGTVVPRTATTIMAEVAGKIVEVSPHLKAGGFFEEGELLLRIDDRDYQANLKSAHANVASAKSVLATEKGKAEVAYQDWLKYRSSVKRSEAATDLALRKPQLKDAESKLDSALADLEKARNQLDRTRIRAPYDGIVRSKDVDIGQYVNTGNQLLKTFAIDTAELRLALPENKLAYINLPTINNPTQTPPAVQLSANIGNKIATWEAALVRTEGIIDERSRALFTVAEIADPYGLHTQVSQPLRIGTFVDANIEGKHFDNLVMLPRHILRAGNKIWVIDAQRRLQNRQVSTLRTEGKYIYVTAGLDDNELVCMSNISGAIPGTEVRVATTTDTNQLGAKPTLPTPEEPVEQKLDIAPASEKATQPQTESLITEPAREDHPA